MVDALRYELGVALEKQLAEDAKAELQVSLAQLPSITQVGMASLLPGAGHDLLLKKTDNGFSTQLGDQPITNVNQRMGVLRKRYGQRFAEMTLNDFVRSKKELAPEVDLLVLRSVEIDSHFENNPETAPGQMLDALKRIRAAINRLKNQHFHDVVIATDHGFFLNHHAEAGDVCSKLPGNWLTVHERCLLGDGAQDHHHYQLNAEKAGIRGDFARLAGPKTLAPYRSGMLYFHGGASLQECVLPVITLRLEQEQPVLQQPAISIRYKNGAKRITTRLPVITLQAQGDLFSAESDFEILLEAHDRKNNVVGEAKAGGRSIVVSEPV
jgi:hypothetical protein